MYLVGDRQTRTSKLACVWTNGENLPQVSWECSSDIFYYTFLSTMTVLLDKNMWSFEWLGSWTVSPNTNFVAMVILHSGSRAKAIEDKLPICHMLALLPYVLISDTRFMRSYEPQLRYYFFIPRCRLISPMTCLFTNICLINLLPWLQRRCPIRPPSATPQYPGQLPTGRQVTA